MSEKVVLTFEQLNAIETWLSEHDDKDLFLEYQAENKFGKYLPGNPRWVEEFSVLNKLSVAQLARVLYTEEYEVEGPKLKEGDHVFLKSHKVLGAVMGRAVYWDDQASNPVDYIESLMAEGKVTLATMGQIFWFRELKRSYISDFRDGDVLIDETGEPYIVGREIDQDIAAEWLINKNIKGIYPAEAFKPLPK